MQKSKKEKAGKKEHIEELLLWLSLVLESITPFLFSNLPLMR
jgi:hypothetical protein